MGRGGACEHTSSPPGGPDRRSIASTGGLRHLRPNPVTPDPLVFHFWLLPFPLLAAIALTSCAFPRVEPAQTARTINPDIVPRAAPALWPSRMPATPPSYLVKQGEAPLDMGTFKNCRVFKAGAVKDGMALFVASRRQFPVKERKDPFTLTVSHNGEDKIVELRTRDHRITLAVVRPAKTDRPRGLAIYLASIMLISREEKAFMHRLQQRGWNVVAITPSIDLFAKDRWEETWDVSQLSQQASMMANEIDNGLAETAYATEAVLAYLQEKDPACVRGPRVVVGASAGTLATPALISRLGGIDAAVYIGGGAHIPEIVLESAIKIYRPRIKGASDSRKHSRSRLKQLALQRSQLDPLKIGPSLPPVPSLLLAAEFDRIVPAHTGKLLYDALGRPERWRYPLGHIALFLCLPHQADRVVDWVEDVVARKGSLNANELDPHPHGQSSSL